MANISSALTSYLFGLLTSDIGLDYQLMVGMEDNGLSFRSETHSIVIQNVPPDIAERTQTVRYPAIYLYCDKLTNSLVEKFANFSGKCRLVIEVRCSQDRIEGIERTLERYVDAVCRILSESRGTWQDGGFYTGGYEVAYAPLKHGGKNFLQTAKISFDVEVSK
jgi:hypothetical protein